MKLRNLFFYCLIMFPSIGLSQSGEQSVAAEQQKAADLTYHLSDQHYEQVEVQAGELSLPVIVSTSNVPISKGAAILLTDVGKTQFSSAIINPLMDELNNHGWNTLSIFSPSVGLAYQGTVPENEVSTEDTLKPFEAISPFSETNYEQHEQQLLLFMNGVMQRAGQYPGFAMVIAEGTSAAWLTKLYAERKLRLPDALVVINPYWPDPIMNQQIPNFIIQAALPILDIYNRSDNIWTASTRQQRLKSATVGLKPQYRQRELIGLSYGNNQGAYLSNEIVGWTRFLGW